MADENKVPAGSEPINPIQTEVDNSAEQQAAAEAAQQQAAAPEPDKQAPVQADDKTAKLEKMLADSQKMIGKLGNELGLTRKQVEALSQTKAAPTGPGEQEQLDNIYKQMDSGKIEIAEGVRQLLTINSQLTAKQVMEQFQQQRQQEESSKRESKFLEDNPDYLEVLESGALDEYMKANPLDDQYSAYVRYQADQKIAALKAETEAKIAAAKEEGAKLAKGAETAGKVIGRQGGSAAAPPQPRQPFKNNQEASAAMMSKLQEIRGARTQG